MSYQIRENTQVIIVSDAEKTATDYFEEGFLEDFMAWLEDSPDFELEYGNDLQSSLAGWIFGDDKLEATEPFDLDADRAIHQFGKIDSWTYILRQKLFELCACELEINVE